jgi:hypothetical protein
MGTGPLALGVKRPGYEADHSLPSCAEVKECVELYIHSPNTPSWRGVQLKNTGITLFYFTFTFTFTLLFVLLSLLTTASGFNSK